MKRVREEALGAYAHQEVPFEKLVEELGPGRDLSHTPLFQVKLVLQNMPQEELRLGQLRMESLKSGSGAARFDLTVMLNETPDGRLSGVWTYCADLFEATTIKRMMGHFKSLLERIVESPDERVSQLPLLGDDERRELLLERNRTAREYSEEEFAHRLFELQAERTPGATAVTFEGEEMTYAELNARANQLAHHLMSLGVGRDVLVGVLTERSLETVVAVLATLKAGGAYVPLDPAYPLERLSFMLEDTGLAVLLTQERLAERVPSHWGHTIHLDTGWEELSAQSTANPVLEVKSEDLAYIIYTSGSTGTPKGVMVEHRGLTNYLHWSCEAYGLTNGANAPLHSSLSFDLTVTSLFGPLVSGGRVDVLREGDVESLSEALRTRGDYSFVKLTPSHLRLLTAQMKGDEAAAATRSLVVGGEQLTTEVTDWWRQHAPEVRIFNEYGPTETVVGCCAYELTEDFDRTGPIPIGRPIANTRLYILDAHRQLVPVGVVGELYIGGDGVARGYLNRPELTEEKFIPDPFVKETGARLYRTGDMARYLADREIEYVGRVDEQVKLRGYRIEPGEIEATLCEHPGVRECAVILREEAGDRRLVAYVVAGDEAHADELRRYAKAQLPDYMVPSAFVMLESLPLTTNGKLDRKALPAPEQGGAAADSYVAPRTPVEEVLAGVWAEVLRVERVGADDNFFDLGGHSLLATQLLSRIREAFAVEISLKSLFESPTVAGVAVCVEAARRDDDESLQAPPMTRALRDGVLPLSFAQQRLWFLSRLEPESAFYNTPTAMHVAGRLDVSALESALSELVRRHEALRTRFVEIDGRPAQVIDEARPVRLRTTDLGACADDEREAEALRLATEEARRPFDLAAGPLLRAGLLRLSEEEHVVLFTLHHIISDGWSHGVLINEVRALYEAFAQGRPSPLAELDLQYADYAVWQRRWLSGEVLEAQLDYWRRQLAGAPTVLEMPTDRPRPAVQTFNGARASVVIESELRDALDRLSRREGSTLYMTLLAAFQILLSRYSEQTDVVVGSPVANRNRREIEGLIGFFANTLVLRTSLDGNPSFQELLGRVREVALGAYMHQDVPFEKLVEELQPERSLSHQPLFQVLFNFLTAQNAAALQAGASAQPRLTARSNEGSQTAKFDLNLALVEAERELVGSLEYNTDLYDHATVERMLKHFKILLESIAADPVQPLSALLASIPRQKLSVAIASTFTSEPVAESLGFWMEQLRVPCKFRFASFNQVFQELLDPSSLLATNEGGVNVILVRLEDWLGEGLSHDAAACGALESHVEEFLRALRSAARRSTVGHLLGVDDSLGSPVNDKAVACLRRMKQRLTDEAAALEGVYVLDMPEAFRLYGVGEVHDQYANKVGSVPYTPEAYAALGTALARRLHALRRSPYKVVVLDCDNTLWKGVCGEDGPSGVCVDAPFEALQQMMLKQYEAGTLLCISSKNNEEDVLEVFRQHPEMPLKLEHFVARQIHWGAKSESLKALAAELNLSLDSFVFIDDDALVCAEVRTFCPEVLTLQLPADPAEIAPFLEHVWAFDRLKMTVEDEQRSLFYRQNHEREQLERESLSLEDFLSGLSLDIRIASVQPHQLERVSQLTQRTNQFNATTVRRSAAELRQLLEGGRAECLAVEVGDRFGSYGLVGAVIYEPTTDALEVDTFLLSCRALGRHVEDNMLVRLLRLAAERGLNAVRVPFRRTERNAPAFNFLNRLEAERMTTGEGEVFVFPTSRLADPSLVETAYGYRFHQEAAAASAPNLTGESAPANRDKDAAESADRVGRDVLERKNRVLHRIADSFRTASRIVEVIRAETMQIRTEQASCVPARTPLEDILVNMWADLLKLDRVGIFDNFFKLGGHSLLATQMVSRIQKVLQVELPLRSVFEEPTIAELALRIEAAQRTETGTQSLPLVPVSREQHLPVSFQQGMVLKRIYRDKEQNSFNIRKSVGIQGRPDIDALEASFAEIIRRHESLRTSFVEVDGQWMQVINPPSDFKLSLIDLRELPEAERGKEVQRLAIAEIARRFNLLSDDPVLRASLVRLADEEYALIIIMHHIAGDGWSIGLVIKELSELYRAHVGGEASTLPELSFQYADYAYWQNRQLQGEAYEELLSYWTRQLDGMPYTMELPTDYPRPLTPDGRVRKERLTLSPAMVGDLNELSRREGVSLYILLLAAYKTMLYRHAGLEDILVWADIANRHHAELEGVIGYLSNEIVFRTKLSGDLTFRELLERVREVALGAYRHQALPYSVIEQSMEGKVNPSASPLLQFSFSMQNASNGSPTTLPGLGFRPLIIEDEEGGMSGELEMNIYENERGMVGVLSYNANLFKPETAGAMMSSLAALLTSIIADPEQSLDSLSCEEGSLVSA
jgi:amino acid adenylation domain-containing protein/FkbH-like protein